MTYPTTPVFQALNLRSNDKTLVSQSVNGRTQSRKLASQYWEFSAVYPPMTRAEFMPVYAFIMKQGGQHQTFDIQLPVLDDTQGDATGNLVVTRIGGYSAGAHALDVDATDGVIKEGDFIKFGHDKVYMITQAITHNGVTSLISIYPPLRQSISDGDLIQYRNVTIKVRLKNDVQEFGIGNDGLFNYEVDFIEAL